MNEEGTALIVKVRRLVFASVALLCVVQSSWEAAIVREGKIYTGLKGAWDVCPCMTGNEGGWELEERSVAMCYPGTAFTSNLTQT